MEENMHNDGVPQEEYVPRPLWQVWLARFGLVVMLTGIGLWLYNIAFPL